MRRLRAIFDRLGFRLALMLAVALLPLLIVSIIRSQAVMTEARARSQTVLAGETLRAVGGVVSLIDNAKGAVQALSRNFPQLLADPAQCQTLMQDWLGDTVYTFIAFIDLTGDVPCSSAPEPFSLRDTQRLQELIADPRLQVRVIQNATVSGTSVLSVTAPVADATGALIGFAAISVPHTALRNLDRPQSAGATFLTVDAAGTVLTAPGELDAAALILPLMSTKETIGSLPRSFSRVGRDGVIRVYAITAIVGDEIFAIGTWPEATGNAEQWNFGNPAVFSALMWLASLAVAWFASDMFVTRHVRHLRQSMRRFGQTRLLSGTPVSGTAPAEIMDVGMAFVDMTEQILHDEAELEDISRQKDILLREVHHRVKNNLQLIASIMSLQMRQTKSPEVVGLLRSLQDRINSLATIHKGLYQTTGQADVWIDELLLTIVNQTVRMGVGDAKAIDLHTDIATLQLNPDQAVPLALMVTEALTNALKNIGSPDGTRPRLSVTLATTGDDHAELAVFNTLPPSPGPLDAQTSTGLGTELLDAFAMQLGGTLTKTHDGKAYVLSVRFPIEPLSAKT